MFCCSQCNFTANFESALLMHKQLHHHDVSAPLLEITPKPIVDKGKTVPRTCETSHSANRVGKVFRLSGRTSSATRLFDRLRTRISRSRTLFSHPEEVDHSSVGDQDLSVLSEGDKDVFSSTEPKETFSCHLCPFDTDRITTLDRHLLNDHKIGLETLLKLVMNKTKDGLTDDSSAMYGVRQTYYKPVDQIIQEGEILIETVTPKIKILKHASTNTDLKWHEIPDLKNNCRQISQELEKLMAFPGQVDREDLMSKIQVLNECMYRFADSSSNTLKKVLTKEFDTKKMKECNDTMIDLGLGDSSRDGSRKWGRAQSENLTRARHRSEKSKLSSDSFYF